MWITVNDEIGVCDVIFSFDYVVDCNRLLVGNSACTDELSVGKASSISTDGWLLKACRPLKLLPTQLIPTDRIGRQSSLATNHKLVNRGIVKNNA